MLNLIFHKIRVCEKDQYFKPCQKPWIYQVFSLGDPRPIKSPIRAYFLGKYRIFCFNNISKFGSFNSSLTTIINNMRQQDFRLSQRKGRHSSANKWARLWESHSRISVQKFTIRVRSFDTQKLWKYSSGLSIPPE